MRLSLVVTTLSILSLAACSSPPKAPAAPVQANQAAATTSDSTATTDSSQDQPKPRRKYMNTGSRLPSESVDPSVGDGPAGGLNNSSTNAASNGPR